MDIGEQERVIIVEPLHTPGRPDPDPATLPPERQPEPEPTEEPGPVEPEREPERV